LEGYIYVPVYKNRNDIMELQKRGTQNPEQKKGGTDHDEED